ncbi:MAG: trypsin-like peptidase domain-containing protein [Patescibacteria group bacterium]
MDFINTLLSYFLQTIKALVIVVVAGVSALSSFLPPPQAPISITPPLEQNTGTYPESPAAEVPTKEAALISEAAKPPAPPATGALLDVNGRARATVVNILCLSGGAVRAASGSGVFIDTRGVILTNAHVGQFFLLRDYPKKNAVDCVVRTGSPARNAYYAELLYLPPTWVSDNASQITLSEAMGTGEHDYAFLLIDRSYGGESLPAVFPAIGYTLEEPASNDPMLLAAYPSAFLKGRTVLNNLQVSSTFTIVKRLYSFDPPKTVDLFSIGSTTISQGGSSGGASVRASDGNLMGIITVASDAKEVVDRDLRAISVAHINRSLIFHGEGSISSLLNGDLSAKAANFDKTLAPTERAQLIDVLNN